MNFFPFLHSPRVQKHFIGWSILALTLVSMVLYYPVFATLMNRATKERLVSLDVFLVTQDNYQSISEFLQNMPGPERNLIFYLLLALVSLVISFLCVRSLWRWVRRKSEGYGRWKRRLARLVGGGVVGGVAACLMLFFLFLYVMFPGMLVDELVTWRLLSRAEKVVQEIIQPLSSLSGLQQDWKQNFDVEVEVDGAIIAEKIKEGGIIPFIINNDEEFTARLVRTILGLHDAGSGPKTIFEAIAIPQVLYERVGNVLGEGPVGLETNQLWVPDTLVVYRSTKDFAQKIMPVLGDMMLYRHRQIYVNILKTGKRPPKYRFLDSKEYLNLREKQDKEMKIWNELGTAYPGAVQILILDSKKDKFADLDTSSTTFISQFSVFIHEILHYYTWDQQEGTPAFLFEPMTAYLTSEIMRHVAARPEAYEGGGYTEIADIFRVIDDRIPSAEIIEFYFFNQEASFAELFNATYPVSFKEFKKQAKQIFYEQRPDERLRLRDNLIAKLQSG